MNRPGEMTAEVAGQFRTRLTVAMMLIILAVIAAIVVFAQQHAEADVKRTLEREFERERAYVLEAQQMWRGVIQERCRKLAKSVRIRAALEESEVEDLYLNAQVELRDLLEPEQLDGESPDSQHARFFRFLNAKGELLSPPREEAGAEVWEKQLALGPAALAKQQVGYVAMQPTEGRSGLIEVISTPIITTDTSEAIGAIVLGFDSPERHDARKDIETGIWWNGLLDMPGLTPSFAAQLSGRIGSMLRGLPAGDGSTRVSLEGIPHLLFLQQLNRDSQFAPAYRVCLYSLAEASSRQQDLRWKIIGTGLLALLGGLGASHFLSGRFSAPVEQLAEVSAAHREHRVRAEAALEVSEQKYRSIFENAVEGIFVIAADGRILSANPALARICGFDSAAELIAEAGETPGRLYADPAQFEKLRTTASGSGSVENLESEIVRKDGRRVWISQSARAVRGAGGELLNIEGSVEDITERKRAADELLTLNTELQSALENLKATQQQVIQQERLRALGQMASGIAHDFNNALVPILGFCELLLFNPGALSDQQKATRYLETIQTAAKDAASVVARLREFYRADKGDHPFAPVALKRLVEQAVTLTKPKWKDQAQANGATIEIALELEAVPPVSGDESALREVLTNLIFNAVDAMPSGGTLTLRTRSSGDSATLEVADSGTGMTEEVRKRCLDPFFSTKGERGTGLGLSMVFGIVQRHSGLLDIRSEVGRGTAFVITLPVLDAVTSTKPAAVAAAKMRPLHILVVDDEAPVRDTLGAVLAADGHEVETAIEGADGLRRFSAGRFDLVIADKAMPGMNGDQMAAAIKKRSPRTPIVLLTGFGLFHDKEEFPDIDVLASKPVRIAALREAIAEAMAKG